MVNILYLVQINSAFCRIIYYICHYLELFGFICHYLPLFKMLNIWTLSKYILDKYSSSIIFI